MNNQVIKISDYTINPGDPESGVSTNFHLYLVLVPAIERAVESNTKVILDLDGTIGYSAAWLKSSFEKLMCQLLLQGTLGQADTLLDSLYTYLEFKSEEEPWLVDDIKEYMEEISSDLQRRVVIDYLQATDGRKLETLTDSSGIKLTIGFKDSYEINKKFTIEEMVKQVDEFTDLQSTFRAQKSKTLLQLNTWQVKALKRFIELGWLKEGTRCDLHRQGSAVKNSRRLYPRYKIMFLANVDGYCHIKTDGLKYYFDSLTDNCNCKDVPPIFMPFHYMNTPEQTVNAFVRVVESVYNSSK